MKKPRKFLGLMAAAALTLSAMITLPASATPSAPAPPNRPACTPVICDIVGEDPGTAEWIPVTGVRQGLALHLLIADEDLDFNEYVGGWITGLNGTQMKSVQFDVAGTCDDFAGPYIFVDVTAPGGTKLFTFTPCLFGHPVGTVTPQGLVRLNFGLTDLGIPSGSTINTIGVELYANADGSFAETLLANINVNGRAIYVNIKDKGIPVPALVSCPISPDPFFVF